MRNTTQDMKVKRTNEVAEASLPFVIQDTDAKKNSSVTMNYSAIVNGRTVASRVAPVKTDRAAVLEELDKIEYRTRQSSHVYDFSKRVFDICASGAALLVFGLPMLFVALLVKCTSKGPVLFRDKRVGKNGKDIVVYKFRTMYADAEDRIREYLSPEEYERWLVERKLDNDPRITKLGKLLRKTSLDELPQLLNIFGGTLSVIGPRPIARKEMDLNYSPVQQKVLLSCKPGLSGLWAASGRSEVTYEDGRRQKLELEYVKKRSFFFDIKLVFQTVWNVLRRKGAQ